jgi:ketosteroid isomerase-like protein
MQKILLNLLLITALARPLLTQTVSPEPEVQLPTELQRVLRDYEAAWQSHNAHALAQLFATDGYVLAPGQPPVKGRDNIKRAYADAGGPLALRAIAYASEGNLAYIIGTFARRKGDPDVGKFTLTLRKEIRGEWLIVSDMDNSNHPWKGPSPER